MKLFNQKKKVFFQPIFSQYTTQTKHLSLKLIIVDFQYFTLVECFLFEKLSSHVSILRRKPPKYVLLKILSSMNNSKKM